MTTPPDPGSVQPPDRAPDDVPEVVPDVAADPARVVFRTALRNMLVLLAAVSVLGVISGWFIAGTPGVWGALIGVGATLVFSGTTVVTMLGTASSSVTTTAGVVMGAWLAKMVLLIALFAVLHGLTFYDRTVLVVVLVVGVLGSVLLDYLAVRRGRVPYTDPGATG